MGCSSHAKLLGEEEVGGLDVANRGENSRTEDEGGE
jgi:hypothetical protein